MCCCANMRLACFGVWLSYWAMDFWCIWWWSVQKEMMTIGPSLTNAGVPDSMAHSLKLETSGNLRGLNTSKKGWLYQPASRYQGTGQPRWSRFVLSRQKNTSNSCFWLYALYCFQILVICLWIFQGSDSQEKICAGQHCRFTLLWCWLDPMWTHERFCIP